LIAGKMKRGRAERARREGQGVGEGGRRGRDRGLA